MKKLLRAALIDASDDGNQNDHVLRQRDLFGEAKFFAVARECEVAWLSHVRQQDRSVSGELMERTKARSAGNFDKLLGSQFRRQGAKFL